MVLTEYIFKKSVGWFVVLCVATARRFYWENQQAYSVSDTMVDQSDEFHSVCGTIVFCSLWTWLYQNVWHVSSLTLVARNVAIWKYFPRDCSVVQFWLFLYMPVIYTDWIVDKSFLLIIWLEFSTWLNYWLIDINKNYCIFLSEYSK